MTKLWKLCFVGLWLAVMLLVVIGVGRLFGVHKGGM